MLEFLFLTNDLISSFCSMLLMPLNMDFLSSLFCVVL